MGEQNVDYSHNVAGNLKRQVARGNMDEPQQY